MKQNTMPKIGKIDQNLCNMVRDHDDLLHTLKQGEKNTLIRRLTGIKTVQTLTGIRKAEYDLGIYKRNLVKNHPDNYRKNAPARFDEVLGGQQDLEIVENGNGSPVRVTPITSVETTITRHLNDVLEDKHVAQFKVVVGVLGTILERVRVMITTHETTTD